MLAVRPLLYILISPLLLLGVKDVAADVSVILENQKKQDQWIRAYVAELHPYAQIRMQVKKKSLQSLLGRTSESKGEMSLSKTGLFWWKISEPRPSLLVFDGDWAWNEEALPDDLGGGIKVSKTRQFKASPAYRILMALMGKGDFWQSFSPLRTWEKDGELLMQLTPKDAGWNLSLLTLRFKREAHQLVGLSYTDDLENETHFDFSEMKLLKNLDKKLFSYSPPKAADITEL